VSLTAALNALPPVEERPDLIVIDEAQDFDADDWRLVEQLLGERHLWAFTDPRQTFWTEPARGLPAFLLGLAPFQLRQQQRCPDALWNVAALYGREGPEQVPAQLEVGEALKLVEVAPGEHVARIEQEVARLLAAGARPRDIAVLTLSGKDKSALFQLPTLAGQPLVHADAPGASEHLIMDTFLRFKGLERPFVIVSELRGKNVTHYGIRMHLALSRALVSTTVITDADAIAQDAVLVALRAGVSGAR
jgi:superfamily I DNA and RNA helicase